MENIDFGELRAGVGEVLANLEHRIKYDQMPKKQRQQLISHYQHLKSAQKSYTFLQDPSKKRRS